MEKYKVINRFKDTQHEGHVYNVGDTYPVDGKKLDEERAEFLTKKHPKYGVAFLEKVEEEKKEEEKETPKKTSKKKATNKKKSDE